MPFKVNNGIKKRCNGEEVGWPPENHYRVGRLLYGHKVRGTMIRLSGSCRTL